MHEGERDKAAIFVNGDAVVAVSDIYCGQTRPNVKPAIRVQKGKRGTVARRDGYLTDRLNPHLVPVRFKGQRGRTLVRPDTIDLLDRQT